MVELAEIARRAWTEIGAKSEADAAQYRRCLEVVVHFWRRDPLAFGDEATPTTLAGRFADVAHICEDALETTQAGAQLAAELDAARAVVEAIEAGINRDGYCPICMQTESVTLQTGYYTHHEGCALNAYQEARKASEQ